MRAGAAVSLVVFGSALDLAGKAWARAALEPYAAPLDFLPLVSLRLSFNEGVSFSMFASESEGARLHPRTPLGQRRVISALGLGGKLFAALNGIGSGAKLQLRLAVKFLGLQRVAKRQRLFALHL